MAATPSVKVVKSFAYKGGTKLWSNRYHFNGGTPSDATHWNALSDAIVTAEKTLYGSGTTIVQVVGYAAGSDVPVNTKAYTTVGTMATTGLEAEAGEVAILMKWLTTARTAKNHPVYLFNYFHGAFKSAGASGDVPANIQATAVNAYGNSWRVGFSDGTITVVRAGPNGATAIGQIVAPFLTHRDFPK